VVDGAERDDPRRLDRCRATEPFDQICDPLWCAVCQHGEGIVGGEYGSAQSEHLATLGGEEFAVTPGQAS
jgi:hypothetical protein